MDFDLDLDAIEAALQKMLDTPVEQLEKLMRRIRKALAIAEDERGDAATRAVAKETAAKLMAQYGITAAMLAEDGQIEDNVGDDIFDIATPYVYDKVDLLSRIVRAYGGELIYKVKSQQGSRLHVFGMGSDLERIRVLWGSLLVQMANEMAAASRVRDTRARKDVFERSFVLGFAIEVETRIKAAEQSVQAAAETDRAGSGGKSVALVLVGRRNQVQAAVREAYPKVRAGRARSRQLSAGGMSAGQQAGRRADLGGGRLSGGSGRTAIG